MNIGIDISSLQGAHRMRGIGYTLINFINNIPAAERRNNRYVFYALPFDKDQADNPLSLLDLKNMEYEVRYLKRRSRSSRTLPGKLYLLVSVYNQLVELRDQYLGDSRIKDFRGVDVFLQTDQSQSLPRKRRVKKALIVYDIIPFVLEWDYLWSYSTARTRGFSRKAAFRCQTRRWLYAHKLRVCVKQADLLLAISEVTKHDFVRAMGAAESKAWE